MAQMYGPGFLFLKFVKYKYSCEEDDTFLGSFRLLPKKATGDELLIIY